MNSSNDQPATPPAPPVRINPTFGHALNAYVYRYRRTEDSIYFSERAKEGDIVEHINRIMKEMAGRKPIPNDPAHPLTLEYFTAMRAGKVGPTQQILDALPLVFKIYGDEREGLRIPGQQAVKEEARRRQQRLLKEQHIAERIEKNMLNGAPPTRPAWKNCHRFMRCWKPLARRAKILGS